MFGHFFKELFWSPIRRIESRVRGKGYGAQARVKGKIASRFNRVFESPQRKLEAKMRGATKAAKNRAKGIRPKKARGKAGGGGGGSSRQAAAGNSQSQTANRGGAARGGRGAKKTGKRGFMGLFRSRARTEDVAGAPPISDGAHSAHGDDGATQVIDVSNYQDDRAFDVVGWLVPLSGVDRGRDFRLRNGKNIIGTAADCDVVITDPYMSAKHAAVIHQNGIFTLIDLGSTNGTSLNDKAVQKEELIDNDTVRVGRTEMKFKSLF